MAILTVSTDKIDIVTNCQCGLTVAATFARSPNSERYSVARCRLGHYTSIKLVQRD